MVPVRATAYSVVPFVKSSNTEPEVPTKVPRAWACSRNWPAGVVVPCPDIALAESLIWAEPEEMLYVVPATTMLPLVRESV